ncbi:MAG: hypothetical protein JXA94_03480 [Parachlamydiales bacterium]|nr:hypothetical protein [Parachlamydiales bacterium]
MQVQERLIDIVRDFSFDQFKQDVYQKSEDQAFEDLEKLTSSIDDVRVSFFAGKYFSAPGFEKETKLDEIYKTLKQIVSISKYNFSEKNRKVGKNIEAKLDCLYKQTEEKIKNSYFITKIFVWIRAFFENYKNYKNFYDFSFFDYYSYNQYKSIFSKNLSVSEKSFKIFDIITIPLYEKPQLSQKDIVLNNFFKIIKTIYKISFLIGSYGPPVCIALFSPLALYKSYKSEMPFDKAYSSVIYDSITFIGSTFKRIKSVNILL